MNEHREIEALIAVYRDLDEAERRRVDEHLRNCPRCTARLAAYQAMDRTLAELKRSEAGRLAARASDRAAFQAAIAAQRRHSSLDDLLAWLRRTSALSAQLVALTLLAVLVGGLVLTLQARVGEPEPAATSVPIVAAATPTDVPASPGEETVTILFVCEEQFLANFEALADEFEAQNPSIRILIVSVEEILQQIPPEEQGRTLTSAPDTLYYPVELVTKTGGRLRDLTPFMAADAGFAPEDFFPGLLDAYRAGSGTWALPGQAMLTLLFYDKRMFDEAGLAYPSPEWTQADFLAAAQALTQRQGDRVTRYGFVDQHDGALAAFVLRPAIMAGETRLDDPAIVQAVRWYTDLALTHGVMPRLPDGPEGRQLARDFITTGRAAMWSGGLFGPEMAFGTRDVGMALFPTDDGQVARAYTYGYMMSAGTKHPEESWRWLSFLTHRRLLGPAGTFGDFLPARRSVADQSGYWTQFDPQQTEVVSAAAERLVVYSGLKEPSAQLVRAVATVLKGTPVEAALAEAQQALEADRAQAVPETRAPVVLATPAPKPTPAPPLVPQVAFAPPPGADLEAYRRLAETFNAGRGGPRVEIVPPEASDRADCFGGIRPVAEPGVRAELLNLQPLLAGDPDFSLDAFEPRWVEAFRTAEGQWALPLEAQVRVMFYNDNLFEAAGVPVPAPGWTLEEFLERAVALTQGTGAAKQYGFVPLDGDAANLLVFLALQGASPWDAEGRPRFDAPEVVAAVRWYTDLALKHGVIPGDPDDLEAPDLGSRLVREALVRQGQVAMWTGFSGEVGRPIAPLHTLLGMAPLPVGKEAVSQFVPVGLFIAADASDPETCWAWLKTVSAEPTLLQALPARRSVLDSAAFAEYVGQQAVATYRAALAAMELRLPATPGLPALYSAVAEILRGADPQAAIEQAQREAVQE